MVKNLIERLDAGPVLCAEGYPEKYQKGMVIKGLDKNENHLIYHAGTIRKGHNIIANGGRVLNVVGFGKDLKSAIGDAYKIVDSINFEGKFYRKDIGARGLQYLNKGAKHD